MSYTFSRRDFMKYTVLAAAAVAVSGSLTGCSNNPNQPIGKPGDTLSFGGSGSFWGIGSSDKHLLKSDVNYKGGTLTCNFEHTPVVEGTSATADYYSIVYENANGAVKGIICTTDATKVPFKVNGGYKGLAVNKVCENTLTIKGLDAADFDLSNAKKIYIRYYPRMTALSNPTDSYADVFASWDITSLFAAE